MNERLKRMTIGDYVVWFPQLKKLPATTTTTNKKLLSRGLFGTCGHSVEG